ncbi:glutamine amidotransferase [Rhodovibrio salinarum]|uniref:Glutamine amidotransferase n=1 Tax=Rhodovibrio salinarum TaxID=1087 RepID=A0A934V059_9PROT|nr:glutamine amidotransferase [Rhodovibrio salinarum]MBK1697109.1 glutamine amidotransferase [Rhodovibrio salinarum]
MDKAVMAIRHVHFEDLGTFEPVLCDAGYRIDYCDVGRCDLSALDPLEPDLLVVLGGPVGVRDTQAYPFLAVEQEMLKARLAANRSTFGVCLGAQQIAATLGAEVAAMPVKEIGFSPLTVSDAGLRTPLRHLEDVAVLHWHGDACVLSERVPALASTPMCSSQAFALGANVMGVQFHPEARVEDRLEHWLIGHAAELAANGVDPAVLRQQAARHGKALRCAGQAMFSEWLAELQL